MISLPEASAAVIRRCIEQPGRVLLAVAGQPGAGKSTAAARVLADAAAAGVSVVVVPMDGYHLAHSTLERQGLTHVKGAPQTFDAHGFSALVSRIRAQQPGDASVWAPEFRREIEDAVAGAIEVPADAQLVLIEGNYLLLDEEPWSALAEMFDVAWMLRPQAERRLERLIARHETFGRDPQQARAHALGSDQRNADLVEQRVVDRAGLDVIEVDPG